MKIIYSALCVALMSSSPVFSAGLIERACNKMDRRAATRSVCSCIQRVADVKLNRRDQSAAAKFFKDPHLAQVTRQSDNAANERFWLRYKSWGTAATRHCS